MPFFSANCTSTARLEGKTAIVTGCNTGIGKWTVADFYERGARVVMACRDVTKAEAVKDEIIKTSNINKDKLGSIVVKKLDLSSLSSVRDFAKDILASEPQINLLVNNAGVMMCPQSKTEDGFETQFATNHLGHFLLTLLLLPRIRNSTPARIVTVASSAHRTGTRSIIDDYNIERHPYTALESYGRSKLANILFSSELARKLKENGIDGITTYSLHPGVISTELDRHVHETSMTIYVFLKMTKFLTKTPVQGAQTTIYCSVDEKAANETGLYYAECAVTCTTNRLAENKEFAKELWDLSMKLTGLENYDPFKAEDNGIDELTQF